MLFDAIVLAGGRSSRLGGTPKAGLRIRGNTLLAATVASVSARGARRVVVVGPADSAAAAGVFESTPGTGDRPVILAREEPPFGGPAAAIAAGFEALERASGGQEDSDFVVVLACDLPAVDGAVGALLAAVQQHAGPGPEDVAVGADGIVAVDGEQRPQHLLAMYRTLALAAALARRRAAGDLDGLPVRRLVEGLSLEAIAVPHGSTDDVDTWDDAARQGIQVDAGIGDDESARSRGRAPAASKDRPPVDDAEQGAVLGAWVSRLATELGVQGLEVDVDEVLGLAGVAAHAVRRPAAPLTTFVVGYAAGLAAAGGEDAATATRRTGLAARQLAEAYAADTADPPARDGGGPGSAHES